MKKQRDPNQPRVERRAYLYRCAHCDWYNLVTHQHARVGPRKSYMIEMLRERPFEPVLSIQDRGTPRTVPAEVVHMGCSDFQRGSPHAARCGRPLVGGPEANDLCWPEDADEHRRGATLYCKGLTFKDPRQLKKEVVEAMQAVMRLGDVAALLDFMIEASGVQANPQFVVSSDSRAQLMVPRYAGMHQLVLPLWMTLDHRGINRATPQVYGSRAPRVDFKIWP